MRKSILLLCVLGIMTCAGNASAIAAVDEYGNEINWDTDGSGNEDHAGAEELEEPIGQEIEEMRTSQSESEAESVKEIKEKETKAPHLNGKVTAIFTAPENFGKHDIILVIYNKSELIKHEIEVSKLSGYRTIEEVPYGTYEVRGAYVKGDEVNVYNLGIDTYDFTFDENKKEINVKITLDGILESQVAKSVETVESSTEVSMEEQNNEQTKHVIEKNVVELENSSKITEETKEPKTQVLKREKNSKRVGVLIGVILIISGIGIALAIKKDRE